MSQLSPVRQLLLMVLLAGVYWTSANIGLKFAMPAALATLIWPPTGISLAALLIFGYRLWPGVLIGAFLAEIGTGIPVSAALSMAVASTLEALFAFYLLRRFADFHSDLTRVRDLLALTILAAAISTLISALTGPTSLYLSGLIDINTMPKVFANWWMGDALSDLLFGSAVLAIFTMSPYCGIKPD